ncbi:MAG: cell division protein FtsQ [Patiriisocius sp.]|jgi:cell division protein FtsQ
MAFIGLIYGFSLNKLNNTRFGKVNIKIVDQHELGFINESVMDRLLVHSGNYVLGQLVDSVNIQKIEERIRNNSFVKTAEAYANIEGDFFLKVEQRKPVMRIVANDNSSFYVDENGFSMPISGLYSAKVIPCTGILVGADLYAKTSRSIEDNKKINSAWEVANIVMSDPFLSKQFVQLDIDSKNEIVLIPRVGNHEIKIGKADNLDAKFRKLKAFYHKGIEQSNWNIYKSIDLSFDGQVVCKKR